ncbi:BatA domain-containing protein [Bythopirellula polymerisocia]|uniref:VWFA domain-containing protein n=1 Tax=Bythopirellula polymerisocia TaxID=2528003 RepID=A0A5C6CTQ1_9BACT|nr:BatA domain-containing protein [Bythopirellula polymerisocia]TWU27245.1 hypothetical protein Pla144_20160 [Bythopirellula polymerisocia]
MSFLFQSLLTIGLPLVALPLVIHLINLRRHQRVNWAAMDFLLESQKRNKKWIMLRQLLLLMLRTTAIALVVLMLAGPILMSQWGSLLGSGVTHHVLLVDDSYSMSDRSQDTTGWDEAKGAVSQILEQATANPGTQKLTLLRFSVATDLSAGKEMEFASRSLDRGVIEEVNSYLESESVTETAVGPSEAFQAALALPEREPGESRILYVISDFRSRQWLDNNQTKQLLGQLRQEVADLQLVQCINQTHPNLAISKLEPEAGIRAAGVETWMELGVTNFSDKQAVAVPVAVTQDGQKLPAVEFDEIGPGQTVTRRFRVAFPDAGPHQVTAQLPGDALATDNSRYFACDVPNSFPLLVIDGSGAGDDAYYLRTALSPGGSAKPGWSPRVEPPSFLRNHDQLDNFAAIFLLDVPRLDETEVTALEDYVRAGGGVALFLGPDVQPSFYNERLYRDGTGLIPVELDVPTQLLSVGDEETPDVSVEDHPVFRIFAGQRNSFLSVARVNFYYAISGLGESPEQIRVLARLRNDAPFVVEKQLGKGHVVVQLCKLSPEPTSLGVWSNWCVNPVFPVFANELAGYLTSARRDFDTQEVGSQLSFTLPEAEYKPEVMVRVPRSGQEEVINLSARAESGNYLVDAGLSKVSGVWQFELSPLQQEADRKLVAVNVDSVEGDLNQLDRDKLATQLEAIDYQYSLASQLTAADEQLAGFRLGDTLLALLLAALVAEQWLAYRASYHGRVKGVSR